MDRHGSRVLPYLFSATFIAVLFLAATSVANAATLFVTTSGSDTGNCQAAACLTPEYALTQAVSGDTIDIAAGDYQLTQAIDPGSKNIIFQGAGVRGTSMTRLLAAASSNIFFFATAGNTSAVNDMVLWGSDNRNLIQSSLSQPIRVERNVLVARGFDGVTVGGTPTVRGNIILHPSRGVILSSTGTVDHNTVINAAGTAFFGGVRTNNVAYGGSTGFYDCDASETATYNNSFRNTSNYSNQVGTCTGQTGNISSAPRFLNVTGSPGSLSYVSHPNGTSNSLSGTVLTDSNASWTTDQWVGYFVTPDLNHPRPAYFFVVSNTATQLTVLHDGRAMTSYGSSGSLYGITDFTFGTNAPSAGTGSGALSSDLYGTNWGQADMGAVAAQGTSSAAGSIYYVATTGTDGTNTCTDSASPCKTIEHALTIAEDTDTIRIAAGTYNLDFAIDTRLDMDVTFEGGYSTQDNFATQNVGVRGAGTTRLVAATGNNVFAFLSSGSASTVRNFVIQGDIATLVQSTAAVSPTFEYNVFLSGGFDTFNLGFGSNATIRGNIFLDPFRATLMSAGTIDHNTSINADGAAFYGAVRTNNLAYSGASHGFFDCTVTETATNNLAFRNLTNFESGLCASGTGNVTAAPRFLNVTGSPGSLSYINRSNGPSTAVGTNTLTDSNASWTTDQWAGYFVTPNMGALRPQYFYILSNTATVLTVVTINTSNEVRDHGSAGHPYGITDFTYGTNAPGAGAGSSRLATDLYGTGFSGDDIGAVVPQGTSLTSPNTFYVATSGTDGGNACNDPNAPCETIDFASAHAESGDTVKIAAGDYSLSGPISPKTGASISWEGGYDENEGTPFATQNLGVRGTYMTRLIAASSQYIFLLQDPGNTSTIKNFMLQGNGSYLIYDTTSNSSPIIENNLLMARAWQAVYTPSATPTVRNNIFIEPWIAVQAASGATVTNNTAINPASIAFQGGTRTNNLTYAGNIGFFNCNASGSGSATYNLAYRHTGDNFSAGNCLNGTGNIESPPRFLNLSSPGSYTPNANGLSTGMTTTTLTDSTQSWTTDQWAGYFVTPDLGFNLPQYFLIISNTATTLTVVSNYNLTSYGAAGRPYAITDLTYGTNAPGAGAGTTGGPTTDIYGTTFGDNDMGAVAAQGSSLTSPSTYYVAPGGTDTFGAAASSCNLASAPCKTINYAVALAENGDTVRVAGGAHTLTYRIELGLEKNLTVEGGYDTADNFVTQNLGVRGSNMTRLIAASSHSTFSFAGGENTSTIKNFVLQGGNTNVMSDISGGSTPTIENNVFISNNWSGVPMATSNAVVRNNIFIDPWVAVQVASGGTVINNTVMNPGSIGFNGGTRVNNLTYAGNIGFFNCNASGSGSATYSLAYRHSADNFSAGNCTSGTGNLESPPRFLNLSSPGSFTPNANGLSTGMTTTVLTDSNQSWTTDEWAGYYVTPDLGRSQPRYFFIVSNTATSLTVVSAFNLNSYGGIGRPYAITDLTYGTNAPGAGAGTTGGPTTDVYGTTFGANDIGAVAAQGSSLASPTTFYVATTGANTYGAAATSCNSASAPCQTVNYAAALAEDGDTIRVAKGNYSLPYRIELGLEKDLTLQGGYDTADNFATQNVGVRGDSMTRLIAPTGTYVIFFNPGNSSTIENFVLQSSNTYTMYDGFVASSPTVRKNVFVSRNNYAAYLPASTVTLENNIFIEPWWAVQAASGATVTNNTAVNANQFGFYGGVRKNNIAYAGGTGFDSCSGGNVATFSNSFANTTNFGTNCDGGNNLTVDPTFTESATGSSTGLTSTTLTDTNATWTTDQWKGYFVTPDTSDAKPQYFFIASNTATQLTVVAGTGMTSFASSGNSYRISDFTLQSGSGLVNTGTNTGASSEDIYGVARPQATTVDMGATEFESVPNITINDVAVTETESSVNANFTISLSSTYSQGVTVNMATANNTATAGADYTAISTTPVSFTSTETTKIVTVTVLGDTLDEDNETFFVNLSGAVNGTITDSQGVGTINDNDATPSVTFTSSSQASSNETGTMNVTAQLSATSGRTVTVPFTTGGSAGGSDYSISASPITINAGQSSANATITITTDTLDEPNETVVVTMGSPTNATQGATTVHTATITDDDNPPTVQWSASSQSSTNESGTMTVTAQLSTASGRQITVPFSVGGDAIGSGTDYSISASPVTINAGQTTGDATITINPDSLDEDNEQVIVTMGSATNATTTGTTVHTATITDDDPTPTVTLGLSGDPLDEDGGVATVTATLSAVSGRNVTVGLAFSGDATLTSDYTRSGTSISINAGSSSNSITITGVNDDIDDDNEVVTVDIDSCTNCTESGTQQVSATITDDDTAGVSIVETGASTDVTERGPTDTYTVVLTSEPLDDVDITVTPDSETTVNPTSLTFTSGDWDTPQTITVTAVDDPVAEGNHSSTISHSASSTDPLYNGTSIVDVTANIVDDDSAGVSIRQTSGDTAVTEGGATDSYTVELTSAPTDDVVISVATSDLTHGVDRSPNQLTFTTVTWNNPQTVTVTASDDERDEGNHTATLSHTAVSNDSTYDGIGIAPVNVTITDNDQSGISVVESGGSTAVSEMGATDTYTIVLTSEPTDTVTVRILTDTLVTTSPSVLTFDESDWDTPQTVTIEASANASGLSKAALEAAKLQEVQSSSTIRHQVTSNDTNYDGLQIDTVTVSVTLDNSEAEEDDTETESVQFSARAGGDRTIVAGNDVRLDAFGEGTDWKFQWELLSDSPYVSLSSTTDRAPILTIDGTASPQDIEIRLTVTNADGQTEEDTITIHVAKRTNVIGKVLDQAVVGRIADELAYEQLRYDVDSDTFRTAIRYGDATLLLPDDRASYSFSETRDGRLAVSVESPDIDQKAFISRRPADEINGTIDLADGPGTFASIGPVDSSDRWGAYLSTGDVTGDGRNEVIVTDPTDNGTAFIYDEDAQLVGRVYGTDEYPIRSLKVGDYFDGGSDDLCFGPDNVSMNDSLQLQRSAVETLDRSFCLEGGNDLVGDVDLQDRGVDVEIDVGTPVRAIETGDLDGDNKEDLAVATDDGRVLVYFDAFDGARELKEEDVDTSMRRGDTPDVDDCFGQSLTIGDVTGDNRNDLIIGEPCHDESRGRLTVAFGKEEWEPEIDLEEAPDVQTIEGLNPGDEIGSDVFLDDNGEDEHDKIYTVFGQDEVFEVDLVEEVLSDSPLITHSAGGACSLNHQSNQGSPWFGWLLLSWIAVLAIARPRRRVVA